MNNQSTLEVDQLGNKFWRLNGLLHREDGPAVEYINESKQWWLNGRLHRKEGPAFIYNDGGKYWYLNGLLHRADGPAVIYSNGNEEYWLNHVFLNQEEWFQQLTTEQQYNYLWNLDE
jgi:hypothetical protein